MLMLFVLAVGAQEAENASQESNDSSVAVPVGCALVRLIDSCDVALAVARAGREALLRIEPDRPRVRNRRDRRVRELNLWIAAGVVEREELAQKLRSLESGGRPMQCLQGDAS